MAQMSFRFMSWNLKFFGTYDYDTTREWMARTIIDCKADVVVILEIFTKRDVAFIGVDQTTVEARKQVKKLCDELKGLEPNSKWTFEISGGNAGESKRDAYAFFWKETPQGANTAAYLTPNKISLIEPQAPDFAKKIKILRYDDENKDLKFSGNRRPGGGIFRFKYGKKKTDLKDVLLCGYHAPKPSKQTGPIFSAIRDSIWASEGEQYRIENDEKYTNLSGFVIGGDLNLDYPSFDATQWDEYFGVTTGIKQNGGSSLYASPRSIKFSNTPTKYTKNAYDNFLFDGVNMIPAETKVLDVIKNKVDTLSRDPSKVEEFGGLAGLRKEIYLKYYPKKKKEKKEPARKRGKPSPTKTNCISDHFPIIGQFVFS